MILSREQIEARRRNDNGDLIATARAYHDLRDGVLAWCDEPDWSDDPAVSPIALDRLRAVVARVERGGAAKGIDIHRDFGVSES